MKTREKKKLAKIVEIPYCHFNKALTWKDGEHPTIEETGHGNLLCYETYGGRLFRASEEWVQKAISTFVENYNRACRMFDEDPAHEYYEVFSFNDLYKLLNIIGSEFGDRFGYTNIEDYRQTLNFCIRKCDDPKSIKEHMFLSQFDEPILVIEPGYDSAPFEFFREV